MILANKLNFVETKGIYTLEKQRYPPLVSNCRDVWNTRVPGGSIWNKCTVGSGQLYRQKELLYKQTACSSQYCRHGALVFKTFPQPQLLTRGGYRCFFFISFLG